MLTQRALLHKGKSFFATVSTVLSNKAKPHAIRLQESIKVLSRPPAQEETGDI